MKFNRLFVFMMAFLLVLSLAGNQAEAKDVMDQAKDVGNKVNKVVTDAKDKIKGK